MKSDYYDVYSLARETFVGETGKTNVVIDENIETGLTMGASHHLNKSDTLISLEKDAMSNYNSSETSVGFGNFYEGNTHL